MESEMTDLDMEAARQLVHLSEGETTMTTTTTTSSSSSCNSKFYNEANNTNNSRRRRVERNNNVKKFCQLGEDGTFISDDRNNAKIINEIAWFPVAGELEDDQYHEGHLMRKKNRRYRSIVELYSLTKPVKS
ncbi:hypothetical protein BVRB_6g133410 [Beta vulgaris subsp. vulgaris]|nr:hypothetical protein BVRB_6g133410 [Beta vulgaris subsp. vulgaris]